jgi:hypothetical protein
MSLEVALLVVSVVIVLWQQSEAKEAKALLDELNA